MVWIFVYFPGMKLGKKKSINFEVVLGFFLKGNKEENMESDQRPYVKEKPKSKMSQMTLPQKLNIELPHDPAILFPDIRPKELKAGIWIHNSIIHNDQEAETM